MRPLPSILNLAVLCHILELLNLNNHFTSLFSRDLIFSNWDDIVNSITQVVISKARITNHTQDQATNEIVSSPTHIQVEAPPQETTKVPVDTVVFASLISKVALVTENPATKHLLMFQFNRLAKYILMLI